ncbi:hypothetical protein HA402_013387 [Bradysia odoriphaga]|nr:hypothetical protein HA402_013387 [Bradysia odoriphaga]
MATLPCYNPELPYLGLIPGGVRSGTMLRINGMMPYGGNRFSIYLQTGAAIRPRDDTALQLSVRPTEPVIVRNHYENKNWGTEERFGGCPIYPGQSFEILILAEPAAFKIAINGVHFCHFNHRFSMHRVTFICVDGDITLTSITTGSDIPSAPPLPHPLPGPVHPIHPIQPIHPYPPRMSYPGTGHTHRPHYPHHPGYGQPGFIPGPPPPPPYSPSPYPGHRYPYIQTRHDSATSVPAYSLHNDSNYLKRRNRNNAIKYAAVGAGVAGGVGLGAFALSRAFGGGDGGGDGGDDGNFDVEEVDFGGE